jgi:tRNA 5-methylaminomethyl-2-thiouridine biosynthesis bifunctional protein
MPRLPPLPNTHIDAAGLIHGDDFNDSYFSRDNGLEESRTVFLSGCGLPQAWENRSSFVIGELGFGTGLNILAAWDLWNKNRPIGGILHIVTVEGFLLDADIARAAHAHWPELAQLSAQLIAKWPTRAYGAQRIWFPDDGLCITFLVGPCEDVLKLMDFEADCWFLDGFSPSKNPQMWSQAVFAQIARLSAPDARLSTYSVAGLVKSGLREAGFSVVRRPGYGSKRERLEAHLTGHSLPRATRPTSAIVIGGGIAGASLAAACARRGMTVELFDADPCGQTKASGNPIALITPRLDRGDTFEARFLRSAYLMALTTYQDMGAAFDQTGVLEVRTNAEGIERTANLAADPPLPESHLRQIDEASLLHIKSGLAYPDLVLRHLKQDANCHPIEVARVEADNGVWSALDLDGHVIATADICLIANGPAAGHFCDLGGGLRGRIGQLSWAPVDGPLPDRPISGGAYGAPFHNKLVFGATFSPWNLDDPAPEVTLASHVRNRDMLAELAPELAGKLDIDKAAGRTSLRAATVDQLPIAGAVGANEAGKYVLCGLGSRGFTTAFLSAELIVSNACGEPSPVEALIGNALAPDRFAKRAAKRGQKPAAD